MSAIKQRMVDFLVGLVLLPAAKGVATAALRPSAQSDSVIPPVPGDLLESEAQLIGTGLRIERDAAGNARYVAVPRSSLGFETQDTQRAQNMLKSWMAKSLSTPHFAVTSLQVDQLLQALLDSKLPEGKQLHTWAREQLSNESRTLLLSALDDGMLRLQPDARARLEIATGRDRPVTALVGAPADISPIQSPATIRPLRVVVTGYGSFMGITDNPSANLAKKLSELGYDDAVVEFRKLDVTTEAVDAFVKEMKQVRPDVILSMGVGGQAQIEERPENRLNGGVPDGNGKTLTARSVVPGAPSFLPSDLPVDAIEAALATFGSTRVIGTSRQPGYYRDSSAYLCNYLGYKLALAFGSDPQVSAGFMHVTSDTPVEQAEKVLRATMARRRQEDLESMSNPVPVA